MGVCESQEDATAWAESVPDVPAKSPPRPEMNRCRWTSKPSSITLKITKFGKSSTSLSMRPLKSYLPRSCPATAPSQLYLSINSAIEPVTRVRSGRVNRAYCTLRCTGIERQSWPISSAHSVPSRSLTRCPLGVPPQQLLPLPPHLHSRAVPTLLALLPAGP